MPDRQSHVMCGDQKIECYEPVLDEVNTSISRSSNGNSVETLRKSGVDQYFQ